MKVWLPKECVVTTTMKARLIKIPKTQFVFWRPEQYIEDLELDNMIELTFPHPDSYIEAKRTDPETFEVLEEWELPITEVCIKYEIEYDDSWDN